MTARRRESWRSNMLVIWVMFSTLVTGAAVIIAIFAVPILHTDLEARVHANDLLRHGVVTTGSFVRLDHEQRYSRRSVHTYQWPVVRVRNQGVDALVSLKSEATTLPFFLFRGDSIRVVYEPAHPDQALRLSSARAAARGGSVRADLEALGSTAALAVSGAPAWIWLAIGSAHRRRDHAAAAVRPAAGEPRGSPR